VGGFGPTEILIVVAVVFVLFGGWRRLPRIARGTGQRLRESKTELIAAKDEFQEGIKEPDKANSSPDGGTER
jgi:TatA/E family protein of Tat protein translocase